MKRNLIFVLALMSLIVIPVKAEITVEEATDAECLMNSGYSQLMAEDVFMMKNRAMSKPIEPLYDKNTNKFVNFFKRAYAYIDPAIDSPDRIHHDMKLSPAVSDL